MPLQCYLHNIRQSGVARLIEAQVRGKHGRQADLQLFAAGIGLSRYLGGLSSK
jgi:hypothetical protein